MTPTRKLKRSSDNKMLAGVCGGIAEYFSLDPTVVRIIYIVISLTIMGFPGLLAYGILAIVMPDS
jgi:phage shock protein C